MKMIAQKKFEIVDQKNFTDISGDSNPIHIDEILSRRLLFGEPVVHGMHLVMWALDELIKSYNISYSSIQNIQANFHKGVLLNREICLKSEIIPDKFILRIYEEDDLATTIHVQFGQLVNYAESLSPMSPAVVNPTPILKGSLALMYDSTNTSIIFPRLSSVIPDFQLSVLLTTTRLVGMECPGLNSLYSSLNLTFDPIAIGIPQMEYEASNFDELNGTTIKVKGPGFTGNLRAYLRPEPIKQPGALYLKTLVNPEEFKSQNAIIIGGSRGMGEVVAKLLSFGGAKVTFTYNKGMEDAIKIQKEIWDSGFSCSVLPYDCESPHRISGEEPFTHLYYFATPRITTKRNGSFSDSLFQKYCKYYVTGFFETIKAVGVQKILYPSTVSLETNNYELPEYRAAKAAGEEICRQMNGLKFKIYSPRLPRLLTDQTSWFFSIKTDLIESIMLNHIREMEKL